MRADEWPFMTPPLHLTAVSSHEHRAAALIANCTQPRFVRCVTVTALSVTKKKKGDSGFDCENLLETDGSLG